jgi:hypothetical protein
MRFSAHKIQKIYPNFYNSKQLLRVRTDLNMDKLSKPELLVLVEKKNAEINDLKAKKKTKKIPVLENMLRRNSIRSLARVESVFYQALDAIDKLKSCLNKVQEGYVLDHAKWSKVHPNDLPIVKLSFEDWTPELVQVCLNEETVMKLWFNAIRTFRDSANHMERQTKNAIHDGERPDPPEYDLEKWKEILDGLDEARDDMPEGWTRVLGLITRDHKKRRNRERAKRVRIKKKGSKEHKEKKKLSKKRKALEVVVQVGEGGEEEVVIIPPLKKKRGRPRTRSKK